MPKKPKSDEKQNQGVKKTKSRKKVRIKTTSGEEKLKK